MFNDFDESVNLFWLRKDSWTLRNEQIQRELARESCVTYKMMHEIGAETVGEFGDKSVCVLKNDACCLLTTKMCEPEFLDFKWMAICRFYTKPEFRGQGHGSAMLRKVCDGADRYGITIRLSCFPFEMKKIWHDALVTDLWRGSVRHDFEKKKPLRKDVAALAKLYKRFGFIASKRPADIPDDRMYRFPPNTPHKEKIRWTSLKKH